MMKLRENTKEQWKMKVSETSMVKMEAQGFKEDSERRVTMTGRSLPSLWCGRQAFLLRGVEGGPTEEWIVWG
jgi:hypothetical protein